MPKFSQGNIRGSKLSNEQVFEIRRLYSEGETQAYLSRTYGVNVNTIGRIVRGESRQGVPPTLPELDHEGIQRRLLDLQASRGDEVLNGVIAKSQKVYDKEVKPERELEKLKGESR